MHRAAAHRLSWAGEPALSRRGTDAGRAGHGTVQMVARQRLAGEHRGRDRNRRRRLLDSSRAHRPRSDQPLRRRRLGHRHRRSSRADGRSRRHGADRRHRRDQCHPKTGPDAGCDRPAVRDHARGPAGPPYPRAEMGPAVVRSSGRRRRHHPDRHGADRDRGRHRGAFFDRRHRRIPYRGLLGVRSAHGRRLGRGIHRRAAPRDHPHLYAARRGERVQRLGLPAAAGGAWRRLLHLRVESRRRYPAGDRQPAAERRLYLPQDRRIRVAPAARHRRQRRQLSRREHRSDHPYRRGPAAHGVGRAQPHPRSAVQTRRRWAGDDHVHPGDRLQHPRLRAAERRAERRHRHRRA